VETVQLDPRPEILENSALARILDALPSARVVGGAVRDAVAGLPASDVDLATPQEPADVVGALDRSGIRSIPTGVAHGTVTALVDGQSFEVTTLRRDVQTDGRHAVVAFTDDWTADAARRDFTINAMSMTRDGRVYDYFGGIADLRRRTIRFVGDPASRIKEDYLRVLRYFRFFARYGEVAPAEEVQVALRDGASRLSRLSAERIWNELKKILSAPDPRAALLLMCQLGILTAVLPPDPGAGNNVAVDLTRVVRLIGFDAPIDPILRLAALSTATAEAVAARLKMSNFDRDRLAAIKGSPRPAPQMSDDDLRRLLADTACGTLCDRTWIDGEDTQPWHELRTRLATIPRPVFPLEGRDILSLGSAPGPYIGNVLREVRAWWLQGGCRANADACRSEAARVIRQRPELPPHAPG
jgi:poly(A) polymerase